MLSLVLGRLRAQRRLLLGVVALMTAGSALLGLGSLLLTVTEEQALRTEVRRLPPEDFTVTAFMAQIGNADAAAVRRDAGRVVGSTVRPFSSTESFGAVSVMRRLGDARPAADRLGYLASSDDLQDRAGLVSGRWPRGATVGGALEAAVPEATARLLGLSLGSRVTLGREIDESFVEKPVTVVVVGTFRPGSRTGWQQDPLSGAGFDPAYSNGAVKAPAYGPFEVAPDALERSGSSFASVRVTARPRLDAVTGDALEQVARSLEEADPRLSAAVGDRVEVERVASDLPRTLEMVRLQQAASRATVLVAVLLGTALAVAALLLAGRAVSVVRAEEQVLLVGLGAGRRQLLAVTLGEGVVLAAFAGVLAVPLAALLHGWLTHVPALSRAGLSRSASVTPTLVVAVLLGSVLLTVALVVPALRAEHAAATRSVGRAARAARSGIDLLLLALAVASWWQLSTQPDGTATSGDAVQVVAPVVCLTATAVVAVRLLPLVFGLVARSVRRSRSLLLPLAVVEAARRPPSATASVLLVAAVASGTFGLCLSATWQQSQADQAALRVGTDLSVGLTTTPTSGDGARLGRATGGRVAATTARPVALGRYVGEAGAAPTLVATDARQAGELFRGRPPDGSTWAGIGREIAAERPVTGPPLPATGAQLEGSVTAPVGSRSAGTVRVTPTLVVQDASGLRTTVTADAVPLDARPHRLEWDGPVRDGQRVVAVQLAVSAAPTTATDVEATPVVADLRVTLRLPGPPPVSSARVWTATSLGQSPTPVASPKVRVEGDGSTSLVATAKLSLLDLQYVGARIVATAFPAPSTIPVVVSRQLVDSLDTRVGGAFALSVDGVRVQAQVVSVVPSVPSAPGRIAVLADQDTLSRALIAGGRLEPVSNAWWVAHPRPGSAADVRALGLGDVVVRREVAEHLEAGPLGVLVPSVLVVLVLAAVTLAVAGTGVRLSVDLGTRAAEIARLRALGLSRGMLTRLLSGQHAGVLVLLVGVGVVLGAGTSAALATLLVRSDAGLAPVPTASLVWPWPAELVLVGAVSAACLVLVALLATVHVRRSDATLLRAGGA